MMNKSAIISRWLYRQSKFLEDQGSDLTAMRVQRRILISPETVVMSISYIP